MGDWLSAAAGYAGAWLDYQVRSSELPGCLLSIARGGELVTDRAFGVADLATGVPLTTKHRFRVASHSKVFTAAGLMLLREQGRLHLDDPIRTYVQGSKLRPNIGAGAASRPSRAPPCGPSPVFMRAGP